MEGTYNCGEQIRKNENNTKLDCCMSEKYSISRMGSESFKDLSQTRIEIKDSLQCLYHLKKINKRIKCHRNMKPYSRNEQCAEPFESNTSIQAPIPSKTCFPSVEHCETENTANTKCLKITNPNGTTTEITLKPVILMHVREMPAETESDNKEIYQLASTTSAPSATGVQSNISPEISEPQKHIDYEGRNHQNINVLRVKSSRNSMDLSSERKLSCMKMRTNLVRPEENFKCPGSNKIAVKCFDSKISSINLPMCPNVSCFNHNSIPNLNRFLGVLLSENNLHNNSEVNYSVATFIRRPSPSPSNTSSSFHNEGKPQVQNEN